MMIQIKTIVLLACSVFTLQAMAGNDTDKKKSLNAETKEKKKEEGGEKNYVYEAFSNTRLINSHSTEMLRWRVLDFRISHRFGDIGGDVGGADNMWGIYNAADIGLGFEYGIGDDLNVGINRYKGPGPWLQIMDTYIKYRPLRQTTDNKMPVSVAVVGTMSYTTMDESEDQTSVASFRESAHRINYTTQLLISRKFGDRLSLMLMPTYVHRNYVAFGDENSIISIGAGGYFQLTKSIGIQAEYFHNLEERTINGVEYVNALSGGVVFNTGGHRFAINFTNSRGLSESQFIPYTTSKWSDGQYRFGFTISRPFKL